MLDSTSFFRVIKTGLTNFVRNLWLSAAATMVMTITLVIFSTLFLLFVFTSFFDRGEDYEPYKDQIRIADSQIAFGDTKSGATVAVVGTITNASRVSWRDIQFHVDFLNAAGKRADVGEREDYNFRLPPRETSSFKVSFRREFPETNHVTPVVRVVGAKDLRARW